MTIPLAEESSGSPRKRRELSFRPGLSGKLFAGALAAAIPPLAIALVSSVAVYLAQAKLVGAEIVQEKTESARILLEERIDGLTRFVGTASRQNALIVNLDLGLDQAVERYLASLAAAEGLSVLRVDPVEANPVTAIEVGPRGPELVVRRELNVSAHRRLGTLTAALPLADAARRIAAELGVAVLVLDSARELLLAVEATPGMRSVGERSVTNTVTVDSSAVKLPGLWQEGAEAGPAPGFLSGKEMLYGASAARVGATPYWIAVAYRTEVLSRAYKRGLTALAVAGAVAFALAALVTVYFTHTVARPAVALAATAHRIAEGHYGLTSGIRLNDEVGNIARELDFLSYTLSAQKEQRDVAEEALRQSELQFRSIFDSVDDGIIVHHTDSGAILDVNPAGSDLFGYPKEELLEQAPDRLSAVEEGYGPERFRTLLVRAARGESIRTEWRSLRKDGRVFWTELVLRPARIGGANRVLATYRDIDARKAVEEERARSLREKETLLREVHHRVKNNFQVINSLFSLQEAVSADEGLAAALREPRARIHAMAMVHERLYHSKDLEAIDFGAYTGDLAEELYAAYVSDPELVDLELHTEPLLLHIDRAIPCGLILNELLTNAFKYAFPPSLGRRGHLTVRVSRQENEAALEVADDGIGIPAGAQDGSSLGLTLAAILTKQLAGSISIEGTAGTRAQLRFPLTDKNPTP